MLSPSLPFPPSSFSVGRGCQLLAIWLTSSEIWLAKTAVHNFMSTVFPMRSSQQRSAGLPLPSSEYHQKYISIVTMMPKGFPYWERGQALKRTSTLWSRKLCESFECWRDRVMVCTPITHASLTKTYFFHFVYFWERERENTSGRGAKSEGDKGSKAVSALTAEHPVWGSNSQTMRS